MSAFKDSPAARIARALETQLQTVLGDFRSLAEPFRDAPAFHLPKFDESDRAYVDCPTYRGFPLGGIGNGGISLYADGDFSEARLNHSWYVPARDLRGSFFALRTRAAGGQPDALLLRRTHHHSRELDVRNVAHTRFKGEVPSFQLDYEDALPVSVRLSGFSPLIPHNLKDSTLPAVLFSLDVENLSTGPLDVSLLMSWQNVLGITGTGGSALIAPHTFRCDYSRDGTSKVAGRYREAIELGIDRDFPANDPRRRGIGTHLISTDGAHDVSISNCLRWDESSEAPSFWQSFEREGELHGTTDKQGKSAALCVRFKLNEGQARSVHFQLCWFMPHYVLEKNARTKIVSGRNDGIDHGLYAANFFRSVHELDAYVRRERARLEQETLELPRLLHDSEHTRLPHALRNIILNATDSLWTNTIVTQKGELYTMEALDWRLIKPMSNSEWPFGALTGTIDQRLSAHPYTATFFPALDLTELDAFRRLTKDGKVPHGNGGGEIALGDTDTPYSEPLPWLNAGHTEWPDLTCSWILQFGKWVRTTGEREQLDARWQDLCAMSEYLERLVQDGVPEGASSYDIFVYEPCFLYTATLYVAACSMLADLAELVSEHVDPAREDRRALFLDRVTRAGAAIERKLWNEEHGFYRVCEGKDTLFQGGLAGDWVARLAGLEPVVPSEHARAHSRLQYRMLVDAARKNGELPTRFGGRPLPYNEATLEGQPVVLRMFGVVPRPAINYVYQTLSYQALESIYLNNVAEGLDTIGMVFEKVYAEGYPWDMNLMGLPGFVYMTHPVMWATFNALSGAAIDLVRGTLTLAPRPLPGDSELRTPVFFPTVWLGIRYDVLSRSGEVRVLKRFGEREARLSRLVLRNENDEAHEVGLPDVALDVGVVIPFSIPA